MIFNYIPGARMVATEVHTGHEKGGIKRNDSPSGRIDCHGNGVMTVAFIPNIAALLRGGLPFRHDYDMLDIPTDPEKTIQFVELYYSCGIKPKFSVWLCADNAVTEARYPAQSPCRWQLNRKVENLTLISTAQLTAERVKTTVTYEEPQA